MTDLDLNAIRQRYAAAASGPWDNSRGSIADFIRQARKDVPALLARVAELEQERDAQRRDRAFWAASSSRERQRLASELDAALERIAHPLYIVAADDARPLAEQMAKFGDTSPARLARAYLDLHTWAEQARTALQRMRQANEAYTDDHEDDSSEAQPLCSICQEWFDADETLGRLLASFPGREDE